MLVEKLIKGQMTALHDLCLGISISYMSGDWPSDVLGCSLGFFAHRMLSCLLL